MFPTLHRLGGFIAKKRPHLRGDVVEESAPGQPIIGLLVDVPDFHAHPRAIKRCVGGSDFQNTFVADRTCGPSYRGGDEKEAEASRGAVDDPTLLQFFFLASAD